MMYVNAQHFQGFTHVMQHQAHAQSPAAQPAPKTMPPAGTSAPGTAPAAHASSASPPSPPQAPAPTGAGGPGTGGPAATKITSRAATAATAAATAAPVGLGDAAPPAAGPPDTAFSAPAPAALSGPSPTKAALEASPSSAPAPTDATPHRGAPAAAWPAPRGPQPAAGELHRPGAPEAAGSEASTGVTAETPAPSAVLVLTVGGAASLEQPIPAAAQRALAVQPSLAAPQPLWRAVPWGGPSRSVSIEAAGVARRESLSSRSASIALEAGGGKVCAVPVHVPAGRPTLLAARGPVEATTVGLAIEDANSAASTTDSGAPLAAARAALAAAEAALARELPHPIVDAFENHLRVLVNGLGKEQRAREQLSGNVLELDRRLAGALSSISDVTAARVAAAGATEAMLNALRQCVDELSRQCAWPGGAAPVATLAEVVCQQGAQLQQLMAMQQATQSRLEQQQQNEVQLAQLQAERRELADAMLAMREQQQQLRAMQQQVCSVTSAAHAKATAGEQGEVVAQVLGELRGQQEKLELAQQQQEEVLQSMFEVLQNYSVESAQSKGTLESVARELRGDIAAVAESVRALFRQFNEVSAATSAAGPGAPQHVERLEGQLRELAAVVDSVSARVEELGRPRLQPPPPPAAAEPQAAEALGHAAAAAAACSGGAPAMLQAALGRRCVGSAVFPGARSFQYGDPPKEALKAPSPRKWLAEPLSLLIARDEGRDGSRDEDSRAASLKTAPVLGYPSSLTRGGL